MTKEQIKREAREMAEELEECIIIGNNHGYGLRIGDEALSRFQTLKQQQPQ